jgi:hypothetical protein
MALRTINARQLIANKFDSKLDHFDQLSILPQIRTDQHRVLEMRKVGRTPKDSLEVNSYA